MATLREVKRRENSRPSLNREYCDILVSPECSTELEEFLRQKGFRVETPVRAAKGVDLIKIDDGSDLDAVEAAIQEWKVAE